MLDHIVVNKTFKDKAQSYGKENIEETCLKVKHQQNEMLIKQYKIKILLNTAVNDYEFDDQSKNRKYLSF